MDAKRTVKVWDTATQQEKDGVIHRSESGWNYWNKKSLAENLRFMNEWERRYKEQFPQRSGSFFMTRATSAARRLL